MVFSMLEVLMFLAYSANIGGSPVVSEQAPIRYRGAEYYKSTSRKNAREAEEEAKEMTTKYNNKEEEERILLENEAAEKLSHVFTKAFEIKNAAETTTRASAIQEERNAFYKITTEAQNNLKLIKKNDFNAWLEHLQRVSSNDGRDADCFAIRHLGSFSRLDTGCLFFEGMRGLTAEGSELYQKIMTDIFETGWFLFRDLFNSNNFSKRVQKFISIKFSSKEKLKSVNENIVILAPEEGSMCLRYFVFDFENSVNTAEAIAKNAFPVSFWSKILSLYMEVKSDEEIKNTNLIILLSAMAERDLEETKKLVHKKKLEALLNNETLSPSGYSGFEGITRLKAAINNTASSAPGA